MSEFVAGQPKKRFLTRPPSVVSGTSGLEYQASRLLSVTDALDRLSAETDPLGQARTYQYDANGNRVQATVAGATAAYQTGVANRLLSDGTFQYEYDREGNLTRKTEIASGNVTQYTYDHRNRLVQVQERSPGGIILHEVTYTYDVFDRRIAQTVDADGAGPQPAETTRFVYNGAHVWADFDAAGNVAARYLFGQSIDEILARYRAGEGTAWYLTDHLGTVRDIINAAGAVINHLDYDSFGQLLSQTNPLAGDRYTFTGREYDAALGLYYLRARHYDPRLGRFTAEDPIRFLAGDTNLYRYVGNSPLTALDPWGTATAVEYATKLWAGPVGSFIRQAVFRCFLWEITSWAIAKKIFGDDTFDGSDVRSIGLGVIACAAFPGSILAQAVFLGISETLYLAATGASATEIGVTALLHTIGVAGGSGLSRYGSRVWGYVRPSANRGLAAVRRFLAEDYGHLRIPSGVRLTQPPNPYGKLGSPAHQAKVQDVVRDIQAGGLRPETEVAISTVSGQKATRYMDVVARDPLTGQIVEVHQIGRSLKSNPKVPVSRERAALRDVRHSPELRGDERKFHEY